MHYNIFVKALFAVFLALSALSCGRKIELDEPAGRVVSIPPALNGKINLTLLCKSNINDYLKVNYELIGCDLVGVSGNFSVRDSITLSWEPDSTMVKLAFNGERLGQFSAVVFDRTEGVYFDVTARLTTPTDGVEINWGALYGASYTDRASLWNDTMTALNSGLPGQTPGTGTSRYIQLGIVPNEYGRYGITVDWMAGNMFDK